MTTVNETAASLIVYGEDLDPDHVTKMLGCLPSKAFRKGEVLGKPGRTRIAKSGHWSLSASRATAGDLNAQCMELFGKTSDDLSVWRRLAEDYQVELFVGAFLKGTNEGLSILPETLASVGERHVRLEFDIYSGDDEEDYVCS